DHRGACRFARGRSRRVCIAPPRLGWQGLRAGEGDRLGGLHPIRARRRLDHLFHGGNRLFGGRFPFSARFLACRRRCLGCFNGGWGYGCMLSVPASSPTASSSWKAGEPEPQLHPCSNERGSLVVKTARQGWAETRPALRTRFPVESAHAHSLKRKRTFLARPERRGSPDRRGKRPWVVLRTSSLLPGFPPPAAHRWCRVRLPTEQSD